LSGLPIGLNALSRVGPLEVARLDFGLILTTRLRELHEIPEAPCADIEAYPLGHLDDVLQGIVGGGASQESAHRLKRGRRETPHVSKDVWIYRPLYRRPFGRIHRLIVRRRY
jgi:hypothetical protein